MGKSKTNKYSTLQNSIYMLKAIKKVIPLGFWLMFLTVPFGVLGHFFSIYLPKVLNLKMLALNILELKIMY